MKNRVSLMKNQAPPQTTHPPEYDHLADVAVVEDTVVDPKITQAQNGVGLIRQPDLGVVRRGTE